MDRAKSARYACIADELRVNLSAFVTCLIAGVDAAVLTVVAATGHTVATQLGQSSLDKLNSCDATGTESSSRSSERGIRINAVCPGLILTPMADEMVASRQGEALNAMRESIPMGRCGRADEIADAVLWFCSSAASSMTGQSI